MPYKFQGSRVFVKKEGKWKLLKAYPNTPAGREKAKKYAAALNANVKEKEGW